MRRAGWREEVWGTVRWRSSDRSIDGYIRPSVTHLCRSHLLVKPRKDSRRTDEGGREREKKSPEGPLVAQLSHLPIGPSHVLICLLVNPPVPSRPSSLIGYFALSTFVEPLCFFPLPLFFISLSPRRFAPFSLPLSFLPFRTDGIALPITPKWIRPLPIDERGTGDRCWYRDQLSFARWVEE